MPHVVTQPTVIHHHLKTETVSGEVTINLNLTITINQDGTVQMNATIPKEKKIPDTIYAIPEFESTEMLTHFGE